MTELNAVIFDYGNVLCDPQTPEDVDAMAGVFGIGRLRFEEFYWRKRVPYDKSELTPREYWDDFCVMAGLPTLSGEKLQQVMDYDSRSWSHGNAAMIAWARQLRASGLKTAVLSNMPLPLRVYLDATYDWLHDFDYRVFSCDVNLVKPQSAIYELCLTGLGVAPGDALFLDDRPDNITAARDLGIHGLLFTTPESAHAEIDGRYSIPRLLKSASQEGALGLPAGV